MCERSDSRLHIRCIQKSKQHGAEIEEISLDRGYTSGRQDRIYKDFCRQVVARRLAKSTLTELAPGDRLAKSLGGYFETVSATDDEQSVINRGAERERPICSASAANS